MSKIETIVDSLEAKIGKLLHKLEVLQQTNSKLSEELAKSQSVNLKQTELITRSNYSYNNMSIVSNININTSHFSHAKPIQTASG